MIQIIAGEKGEGKTKRLLDMANEAGKASNGHVVRFVETSGFVMSGQEVLFGFICGILSQDNDIEKIFIDGIGNIVKDISNEDLEKFIQELEKTSADSNVDFIMIVSAKVSSLPASVQKYLI